MQSEIVKIHGGSSGTLTLQYLQSQRTARKVIHDVLMVAELR